ncbi:xanthine dehydrogenase family protein molybdopterin-binding subunit [Nocardioides sp. T5]|uniref:xanthine dehydrogenase family protein molybdopterin-binding subunit n=1 Tax=Nocardioides sp. T5 TaxID=3400182 RepID=UPI003A8B4D69
MTSSGPMPVRPKYVGQAVKRREDARLLRGQGNYVADIKRRGTLHMALLRAPVAHAEITSIDVQAARNAAGVVDIMTAADLTGVGHLPCIDVYPDTKPASHPVLAEGRVRYVGQPVAAVVARSAQEAAAAAGMITVAYSSLPPLTDIDTAIADNAPLLYPEFGSNVVNTVPQDVGDVETALATADRVYRESFRIHRYGPMPMETRGVLAYVDSVSQRLVLYTSTQFPHLVRQFLAGVIGHPESKIRVVAPDVGGGFGGKCEFYPEEVLAPLFALRLNKPIRWIESRAEHMVASSQAREQRHDVELAVTLDGEITAMTVESWTNNGAAFCTLATTPASISSAMTRGPYRIPNYRARAHTVVTNKTPLAVYRGAGHPQGALVMERMIDIIAADLGVDRLELRLRNMITADELPYDRGTDIVLAGHVEYDSGDYPAVLERAAVMIGYSGREEAQGEALTRGKRLGIGLCCFVEETSIGPYEAATVKVDASGKVTLLTGSSPHGQGHVTTFSQLVADELEIPIDDITVLYGDTDVITDGVGTFASRSAAIGGAAARGAAEVVKAKAMRIAAHMLEADVNDLEWQAGGAQMKGMPQARVGLGAISQASTPWNPPLPDGIEFNLAATHNHQVPGIAFANAAHAATVEVDAETGEVEIVDYVVVHDCGRVINPLLVEGQVIGGVAQGVGGTMFEELVYNSDGAPQSLTFNDYLLPTVSDMPWVRTDHMESPSPMNPYGFKGAGEGGASGAPGALVNAISDALAPLGVSLRSDGPWTPENVIAEILHARSSRA